MRFTIVAIVLTSKAPFVAEVDLHDPTKIVIASATPAKTLLVRVTLVSDRYCQTVRLSLYRQKLAQFTELS